MTVPSIVVLIFLLFAFSRSTSFLFISAFALLSFGTLAIIPPEAIAMVSLLPAPLAFLMIIMKTVTDRVGSSEFIRNAFNLRYMGLLTLFTVVGVVGALTLPKLLMGQVYVYLVRSEVGAPLPLMPTSSNLTQSAYLLISTLTAISFAVLAKKRNFINDFKVAIIAFAIGVIATGILEYTMGMVGQSAALDIFRTASYDFLIGAEVSGGVRRITGLMSEASAYGALTVNALSLLIFCRNLYSPEMRTKVILPLAGACAVLAAMCTSSTAYVALAMVMLMYFWDITTRMGTGTAQEKRQVINELVGLTAFALIGIIVVVMLKETRELAVQIIDEMVFKKTQSSSYFERKSWNDAAVDAFFGTFGVGTGVGSVRTSNLFINILASTGVLGTALFAVFSYKVVFAKSRTPDVAMQEAIRGAKLCLAPIAIMGFLSGTTSDYGTLTAVLFGIVIGLATGTKKGTEKVAAPSLRAQRNALATSQAADPSEA